MHEDVERLRAAGQKTESAQTVEPFHNRPLPVALRLDNDVGPLRQLRGVHRHRIVHLANAEGLQAFRPAQHLAHHARTLVGCLEAIAAQARHVQENVGKIFVRNYEAVTL
jgi:hypothetical protein